MGVGASHPHPHPRILGVGWGHPHPHPKILGWGRDPWGWGHPPGSCGWEWERPHTHTHPRILGVGGAPTPIPRILGGLRQNPTRWAKTELELIHRGYLVATWR